MPVIYKDNLKEALNDVQKFQVNMIDAVANNTVMYIKEAFTSFSPRPFEKGAGSAKKQKAGNRALFSLKTALYNPIDTGHLRRGVQSQVTVDGKKVEGEVFTDSSNLVNYANKQPTDGIAYAEYIEYGTWKMPPRPFFARGLAKALKSNDSIIAKVATFIRKSSNN